MKTRSGILLVPLLLTTVAVLSGCSGGSEREVLLEEKVTPGEVLTYKGTTGSTSTMGVLEVEFVVTKKVLGKDESGKAIFETNQGEWNVTKSTYKFKLGPGVPAFAKPTDQLDTFLPEDPVKVGDSWLQRMKIHPKHGKETVLEITHKLTGFETISGFDCAVIKSGPYAIPQGKEVTRTEAGEEITSTGTLTMETSSYFAVNEGRLVKRVGKALGTSKLTGASTGDIVAEQEINLVLELQTAAATGS